MRMFLLTSLLVMLGAFAASAAAQQADRGQDQNGWPETSLKSRQGNPYEELAAATGGSVIRMDPGRDRDPALTAAVMSFLAERSPLRARTSVDVRNGRRIVAFDVAAANAPLTVNLNGLGRGRVEILRPDGRPVPVRTYGPDGSIGVFLQDPAPAPGRWTIVVTAPADVTIDVQPASGLLLVN